MLKTKKIFIFLLMLGTLLIFPLSVLADGMVIKPDPFGDRWDYSLEEGQHAFINYEAGRQKMILAVDLSEGANAAVWIFPVPALPEKVVIDVIAELPTFDGEEVTRKAEAKSEEILRGLLLTQIYTFPLALTSGLTSGREVEAPRGLSLDLEKGLMAEPDVVVHEHLEKEGMVSELITAKTAQGIYDYLQDKDLEVEKGSIPVLDHYIGEDYSFVVSWVQPQAEPEVNFLEREEIEVVLEEYLEAYPYGSDHPALERVLEDYADTNPAFAEVFVESKEWGQMIEVYDYFFYDYPEELEALLDFLADYPASTFYPESDFRSSTFQQRGIYVTFPTEKLYYPLLPTSVYGSEVVPATIRIVGWVRPEVFGDLEGYIDVEYYMDGSITSELQDFITQKPQPLLSYSLGKMTVNFPEGNSQNYSDDIKYTKIELNPPSKLLTDDLWFVRKAPVSIYCPYLLAQYPFFIALVSLIALSIIASILAGLVVFRKTIEEGKLKKFSLVGLGNCLTIIGLTIVTLLIRTKPRDPSCDATLDQLRHKGYIWKRRLGFVLLILDIPFVLLGLFVFQAILGDLIMYSDSLDLYSFIPWMMVLVSWGICALAIYLLVRKKPEDRALFDDLRAKNYSSVFFQPKDGRKIGFIALFSLFFVILSVIAFWIMKLSI